MILGNAFIAKGFFYCRGICYKTVWKQTDIDLRNSNKKFDLSYYWRFCKKTRAPIKYDTIFEILKIDLDRGS